MQDIEPYYRWRGEYTAEEDSRSPFFRRKYSEFQYSNTIYNYYIHPQWDSFGSATLYTKILFADYDDRFAILEFLGEWNDCLYNDISFLKQHVINPLLQHGITKYIILAENVLNFHGSDDAYYEEWKDDVLEYDGWACFINVLPHVEEEMLESNLNYHVYFGEKFNAVDWRVMKPYFLYTYIQGLMQKKYLR